MKKALLFILAILFLNNVFSQDAPPEKFKYQAIIKNNKDRVLKNTMVGVEVSIFQTSLSGNLVYQETFNPTTNADGIINLEIGTGYSTNGPFSEIPWGEGPFYLEIGVDINGGSNYVTMGSSQLLSVPYALYAKTAKYIEGVDLGYQILSLEGNVLTLTNGGDPITLPGAGSMSFYYADRDGDGYGDKWSTVYTDLKPEGFVTDNSDCNDNDAKTTGGGVEVCDGIDNDCDGEIDNVLNPPLNPLQAGVCEGSTQTCNGAGGWVEDYSYVVGYEVDETSCDGLDNDGDGEIDEGCTTDADGDGFTVGDGDCNDIDPNVYPGASEICDGVDNNCDDQIDEGFDFQTDPNNCGDCGAACPDGYTCVAGGCEPVDNDQDGYTADVDCDDTDPTVNPSAVDLPDDNFIDSNCDGIDGNASDAIFVSVAGDDSNSGDKLNPMRSINAGIQKAVSLSKNQVYISAGTYQERVIMSNGISLYGGYTSDWSRNATNNVTITGIDQDGYVASLEATSINTTTFIDHINFSTSNATGTFNNQGKSNYGIIVSSSSSLIINKCNINVGNGSNGINGVNGTNGQPGLDGFNGAPGLRDDNGYVPGGANGYLIYNGITYSGGKGGNGVYESTGQNGFSSANGMPGGFGGLSGDPGKTGGNGSNGLPGQTGYYGDGGGSGYVLELWYGGNGQKGLDGTPGTGGGGGGAGGGQTGVFVINGTGNAGGGGGSGGAPGTGGEGGFAGGASVGIILNNSPIQILACSITTGNGGAGGAGGIGGVGGAGGVGGFGGNADTDEIGAGGNGGTGGHGGAGGFGGGGEGGPSIGILTKNSSVSEVGNNFIIGNPGQGGFSTGNPGSAGLSANIRNE